MITNLIFIILIIISYDVAEQHIDVAAHHIHDYDYDFVLIMIISPSIKKLKDRKGQDMDIICSDGVW